MKTLVKVLVLIGVAALIYFLLFKDGIKCQGDISHSDTVTIIDTAYQVKVEKSVIYTPGPKVVIHDTTLLTKMQNVDTMGIIQDYFE